MREGLKNYLNKYDKISTRMSAATGRKSQRRLSQDDQSNLFVADAKNDLFTNIRKKRNSVNPDGLSSDMSSKKAPGDEKETKLLN